MNKRYIDFVPASEIKVEKRPLNSGRSVSAKTRAAATRVNTSGSVTTRTVAMKTTARRPAVTKRTTLEEAKSQKLVGRGSRKVGTKPVENSVENFGQIETIERKKSDKATYKMPDNPFINQEKVMKRPLSKNVYQKKVVVPEEEPSGPVAIISKPEKDKKVSLVVTIIITIILGAAAGTVAFLLLPK